MYWNLDIVCYLLSGAWYFFNLKTQIYLHSQGDLLSIFLGHITIFLYHR